MYFSYIKNRVKFVVILLVFVCLLILVWNIANVKFSSSISILSDMILVLIIIYLLRALFWGSYSYKLYIDRNGVKFIKREKIYSMDWKDVKVIGLTRNKYASINKNSFLYFDGRNIEETLYRFEELNVKQYNDNYFVVQYRKKIVDEIVKYWDKPIRGLYQVEGKNR